MQIVMMLAVMWKVTALDPSHVVVQADRSDDERAAFKIEKSALKAKIPWQYDAAVGKAAKSAMEGRPAFESSLKAGPYAVDGRPCANFGYWVTANGLIRFDVKPKRPPESAATINPMYNVFLKLDQPLTAGKKVEIALPTGDKVDFTYDPQVPSPLFKVNQVGYSTDAAERFVYLGGWMGPLGPYPRPKDGTVFELVESTGGRIELKGKVRFRMADPVFRDKSGSTTPFLGEETVEMDILAAKPGTYFVRIPGIGRSMDFTIGKAGPADLFALAMKGLFQQRCGCAKTKDLTHWTDDACHLKVYRGVNPPEEWEYASCFTDIGGRPMKVTHFMVNNWQARLLEQDPLAMDELSLPGGWHDAADYDRRPMHMRIVGDLAVLYLAKPQNFTDGQLAVPESANGIPDVLDEAVWGLRHLLKGQQKDGGVGTWIETIRHPDEKDRCVASGDPYPYFLSRATRCSSMDYAGYAALLARALEKSGSPKALKLAEAFTKSAERAWAYARTAAPAQKVPMRAGWRANDEKECFYNEPEKGISGDIFVRAAINLYALTKKQEYVDALTDEVVADAIQNVNRRGWSMSALALLETVFTDLPSSPYEKLQRAIAGRAREEGKTALDWVYGSYAYRFPWYPPDAGWVHTMSWGNIHPLHQAKKFVAAHLVTGEDKYLDAAYLAYDYHCGCNPNGETWTAGLGTFYPTSYLSLVSVADGIAEYVPGISPYRNTFGLAPEVSKQAYGWDQKTISQYPILRRWGNLEALSVGASEFTVWETVHDPAIVAGYLMGSGQKPKNNMRPPADDLRKLPGYWCLP